MDEMTRIFIDTSKLTTRRDRLVRQRTQLTNAIRGHGSEFGLTAARGLDKIEGLLGRIAQDHTLPALAREMFAGLGEELTQPEARLAQAHAQLLAWHRQDAQSRRLAEILSLGPIGASLLTLKTPAPQAFKSGRPFSAWAGLTPKDHSTAGKQRLGCITRAGDEALRAVLVSKARDTPRDPMPFKPLAC